LVRGSKLCSRDSAYICRGTLLPLARSGDEKFRSDPTDLDPFPARFESRK
jgi:hypothetical protein